ncbi:MAG: cell surface protein SprA, partial [Saprospiraceae bacterium]
MNRALFLLSTLLVLVTAYQSQANNRHLGDPFTADYILAAPDTIPVQPRYGDFINDEQSNPFDLQDPATITQDVEYDPITNQYIITEKIGEEYYRMPTYMSFREYLDYRAKKQEQDYFNQLSGVSGGDRSGSGKIDPIAKVDVDNTLIDRLFGGTEVDIQPQGSIDLTFGVDLQKVENPTLTERQRRNGGFDFDMAIQMNVEGKIGEKLNLSTAYNTQATFDFDNQMKLDYNTDAFSEDEIIKKIEAGNVSLPLRGTLIQGSQSLFGLKTELQFGHLRITAVASQQKSQQKEIVIEGGSQFKDFEVYADEYDENRHFFLSHFNRSTFEEGLSQLPQVRSLFNITQLEVWITNDRNVTNGTPRQILAIADLAEPIERTSNSNTVPVLTPPFQTDITGQRPLPDNDANPLFDQIKDSPLSATVDRVVPFLRNQVGLQQGRDFEQVNARKLEPSEYSFHPELGFVSLNINVRPDQVVAVGYSYSYNNELYQVGELANANPQKGDIPNENASIQLGTNQNTTIDTTGRRATKDNVLVVKMLKSTIPRVDLPLWDLMMKNFYSIGAYQVNRDDFKMDVFYDDPGQGPKRFLPQSRIGNQELQSSGIPLLTIFGLDQLNVQLDPQPDGVFDFVTGLTIYPNNGRVMFPKLEPFGSSLAEVIEPDIFDSRYVYQQLYDSTVTVAREYPELNRFAIRGSYRTSVSSEISLGAFNIPPGSVTVNGGSLVEGRDYEIDYAIGRIRILDDAILNAGTPIRVQFEDKSLFGFIQKTMVRVRADYELDKKANLGATYLHLLERPFT